MPGEGIGQAGGKSVSGITPQVFRVVSPIHIFLVVELFDGGGIFPIRQAHEDMRQTQADVSRIVALAEHVPLQVGFVVEDLFEVPGTSEIGKALEVQQRRSSRGDERSVRSRRDARQRRCEKEVRQNIRNYSQKEFRHMKEIFVATLLDGQNITSHFLVCEK